MTIKFKPSSCNAAHKEALAFLGNRNRRKLAPNTYLQRVLCSFPTSIEYSVVFHGSEIITYSPNGITLNSHGYHTFTTKERMNRYLPENVRLFQEKKVWYVLRQNVNKVGDGFWWNEEAIPFVDGMPLYGKNVVRVRKINARDQHLQDNHDAFMTALMNGQS